MKVYIETLGCPRNKVDSDEMFSKLVKSGFSIVSKPSIAEVIVVNTCGFIVDAIRESIDVVLELSQFKREGLCKKIIVVGCLFERFKEKIIIELPEVDFFLGTGDFDKIVYAIQNELNDTKYFLSDPNNTGFVNSKIHRRKSLHTAYLKIAEGCNRTCSYCIIPKLRGKLRSKSMHKIVSEAEEMIKCGVKEINLVAQESTAYGFDLVKNGYFSTLISNLARLSNKVWIRFLYGHPETVNNSVIEAVSSYNNVCSYFDIPIQHVSGEILRKMGRFYTKESIVSLFSKIRREIPEVALRTTLMVGFPGETSSNFKELMDFIDEMKIDHLGVFKYSDFEDLPAHNLLNHVDEEIVNFRYNELMSRQLKISSVNISKFIGKYLNVLIESYLGSNFYEGRSMLQAPDIDGIIQVKVKMMDKIKIGDIVSVRIYDTLEYDLIGELCE